MNENSNRAANIREIYIKRERLRQSYTNAPMIIRRDACKLYVYDYVLAELHETFVIGNDNWSEFVDQNIDVYPPRRTQVQASELSITFERERETAESSDMRRYSPSGERKVIPQKETSYLRGKVRARANFHRKTDNQSRIDHYGGRIFCVNK